MGGDPWEPNDPWEWEPLGAQGIPGDGVPDPVKASFGNWRRALETVWQDLETGLQDLETGLQDLETGISPRIWKLVRRALEIGFQDLETAAQDLETGRQDLETGHPGFGNWESWIWKLASLDLETGGLQDLETGRHALETEPPGFGN